MAEPFLFEMNHVTKRFPGVVALNDVTFKVQAGTIHGLVGENGAGKSTLMKILSGTYPHGTYEGELKLSGQILHLNSPADALDKGIGIVPQEVNIVEQLSVAENIVVGKWLNNGGKMINMRAIQNNVAACLAEYNIPLDPASLVFRLTTAQKQLVMISRALFRNPSILILDEPTSSLALHEIEHLFNNLNNLRSKGVTCVFITHKLSEIFAITDRTTVLRDGEVTGEFENVNYNEEDVIAAMVGRKIENLYPSRYSEIQDKEVLRIEHMTIPHPTIANRNVVDDISFSLKKGEILGLAGLVGAGRSEVVNAVIGRLKFSGNIYVNGKNVQIRNPRDAKNAAIALVTEDRKQDGLLPNLEIRPNITVNSLNLFTRYSLINQRKEKKIAYDHIEKFNIKTPSIEQMVTNLSGGNQQKVILAKVLMANPEILLLDEPTKGVDIGAKNEIYKLMLELVNQGISIIMISSELPELLAMCDRFVVLAEGKIADGFDKKDASEYRVMLAATQARDQLLKKEA
jgi:ABC-type sugar transport system ATPase subunit